MKATGDPTLFHLFGEFVGAGQFLNSPNRQAELRHHFFHNRRVRISVIRRHDTEFIANGSFVEIELKNGKRLQWQQWAVNTELLIHN